MIMIVERITYQMNQVMMVPQSLGIGVQISQMMVRTQRKMTVKLILHLVMMLRVLSEREQKSTDEIPHQKGVHSEKITL